MYDFKMYFILLSFSWSAVVIKRVKPSTTSVKQVHESGLGVVLREETLMIGVYKILTDDAYALYIVLLDNNSSNLNSLLKIQLGVWHLAPSLED